MARPELGGTGLLLNGSIFGVLHSGLVYLKVDKRLREEYHAAGMRVLEPRPKQKLDAFLQVPPSVVEDASKLLEHAARAAGRPVPKPPTPKPAPKPASAGESAERTPAKPASAGESAERRPAKRASAGESAERTPAKPASAGESVERTPAKPASAGESVEGKPAPRKPTTQT